MPQLKTIVEKLPVWIVEQQIENERLKECRRRQMEVIIQAKRAREERRKEAAINRVRRMAQNYFDCMASMNRTPAYVTANSCRTGVCTKKRVKNSFSKEEAGTCRDHTFTRRFNNSKLTCVYKTKNY